MWKCVVFILYTFTILVRSFEDQWLNVQTAQGVVFGRMDPDGGLFGFYNIPYATAPTGPHRFKAPLPPPVFLTPVYAIDRGILCPQPGDMKNMREDCLVANVFVPDTLKNRLPVLVIVHGGAYQRGYGEQDKFKELAKTKKIIVVTFNYRLGVHGFLCLGTEGAPGNAGLKDQVALLRWVNTNIRSFGGDPDDVTLAACGAGSGSVDFLTLSSITKGLFKKAIMESGVSTGAVGVQIDPIENAKTYAKLLGFNGEDLSSLEDFYKSATFQQLLLMTRNDDEDIFEITYNQKKDVALLFSPCVESDIGQERVVFNAPYNILKQGNYTKIPLMYGFTNMDGVTRNHYLDDWQIQKFYKMNEKFSDFLPSELHFDSESVKEEVAQRVKYFYFGDKYIGEFSIQEYTRYLTDIKFGFPMLRSLSTRMEALGDKIYLFDYSFVDIHSEVFPVIKTQEVEYCQQFIAVMDEDVTGRTDEYKKMKQTLREYWHSFILNGEPVSSDWKLPRWRPAGPERSPHMSLGPDIQLNDSILDGRAAFWDSIYEKHYRGPVMSYTTTTTPAPPTPTSEAVADDTDLDRTSDPTADVSATSDPTTAATTADPENGGAVSLATIDTSAISDSTTDASAISDPITSANTQSTTIALTIIDYGTSGAVSLLISHFMIVVVSLSFYNSLH